MKTLLIMVHFEIIIVLRWLKKRTICYYIFMNLQIKKIFIFFWKYYKIIVTGLNHAIHATANRLEKSDIEFDLQNAKDGDPKLFEKLRQHYEAKTGKPLTLTKDEFLYMMKNAISEKLIDYSSAKCVNGNCTATVDFYKSSSYDLKFSFGKAMVKFHYNKSGQAVIYGFYDKYDFDPKPWGKRSTMNEFITRLYNIYSSGKAFEIKYPKYW